ncbi:MAG TPA: thioredoxin domain-containing protein, partial [Anaerolineaceae bacterium]
MAAHTEKQDKPGGKAEARKLIGALLLISLVIVIIGGAIIANLNLQAQPKQAFTSDNSRALGPANAAVIIVEYGDFGCTTCKAWEEQAIIPKIQVKYGDKVRFVWRDLPIITPESPKAAEAAYCALDQGKFWQYHDLLYLKAPALSINDLKTYAAQLGLDTAKFNTCLDTGQHANDVQADLKDGLSRGFRATPAFLVN